MDLNLRLLQRKARTENSPAAIAEYISVLERIVGLSDDDSSLDEDILKNQGDLWHFCGWLRGFSPILEEFRQSVSEEEIEYNEFSSLQEPYRSLLRHVFSGDHMQPLPPLYLREKGYQNPEDDIPDFIGFANAIERLWIFMGRLFQKRFIDGPNGVGKICLPLKNAAEHRGR